MLLWVLPPMQYKDREQRALKSKREYNARKVDIIQSTISIISTISGKERARSNLSRVLAALSFSDWLVVYLVARNIDRALFTTLATVWRV